MTMIKAFVMWQPWASLVVAGAKPIEFRPGDYRKMGIKVGQRVAIAAGARKVKLSEVDDLLLRLDDELGTTGLVVEKTAPFLLKLRSQIIVGKPDQWLPMSAIIATVTLGEPKPTEELMPKWKPFINDSDRLEHAKWGWPLLDVRRLDVPQPVRGFQGFFWTSVPEEVA